MEHGTESGQLDENPLAVLAGYCHLTGTVLPEEYLEPVAEQVSSFLAEAASIWQVDVTEIPTTITTTITWEHPDE